MKLADLNKLYVEADSIDSSLFSEMRSNVLLVVGDHYTKKGSRFWKRLRDEKNISTETKIRVTKNHIQKITKTLINNISTYAPGVTVSAKNEQELQDQKAAELNKSVWQDLKHRHKLNKRFREHLEDYVNIGETYCKVFFDPSAGEMVGFEQVPAIDLATGQPMVDPVTGEPVMQDDESKPVFSGDIMFERYFGFNVLRAPEASNLDESRFICLRKMVAVDDLKRMMKSMPDAEDKIDKISQGADETYHIFDGASSSFKQSSKDQVMLREFYFKPCIEYPEGYFCISTNSVKLWDGALPGGVFPILHAGFDSVPTSPRYRSIIKQLRPYQVEINRCASSIATTQSTIGEDKLLIQSGTKVAPGGQLPGLRAIQYQGAPPQILSGRSGEQYLSYMQAQIAEMYSVANIGEDLEKPGAQLDAYTLLHQSLRNKKNFSWHALKFEQFLIDVCEVSLKIAKIYYTDANIIPAVSRNEVVNIAEFKNSTPLNYQVMVEPQTDDAESKIGKMLAISQVLQYAGKNLDKDDIGRMIRAMPYGNREEAFQEMTLDYDNAKNDILAMDRGENRPAEPDENHKYMIKKLINRKKMPDFKFLDPNIQSMYAQKVTEHQKFEAEEIAKIEKAKMGWIPTGGALVGADFYVNDTNSADAKPKRAKIPYEALQWLMKKLEDQGITQSGLEGLQQTAIAGIAGMTEQYQPDVIGANQVPPSLQDIQAAMPVA